MSGGERREAALRRTYELEPAAEVDARPEHELTVQQTVRREVAAQSGEEITGLRVELERPRAHVERVERAVPPAGRPWSSGAGGRNVADLLAAQGSHPVRAAGERRRPR
jgi:hypothetical protein